MKETHLDHSHSEISPRRRQKKEALWGLPCLQAFYPASNVQGRLGHHFCLGLKIKSEKRTTEDVQGNPS